MDCNGQVNSIDALFILWRTARLIDSLPWPDNAYVNSDSEIDARDALLILQLSAGLLRSLSDLPARTA